MHDEVASTKHMKPAANHYGTNCESTDPIAALTKVIATLVQTCSRG